MVLQDHFCIDVKVNNYDSIEAFQFSVNFDPYMLRFDSLDNLNSEIGLDASAFGLQEQHRGIIRLTYFNPFNSFTLDDSTILFSMCFTAVGKPGDLCPVNISNHPLDIEFIANEMILANVSDHDARVDIQGGSEFTLLLSACPTGFEDTTGVLSVSVFGGNPPYFAIWQHAFNSDYTGGFELDTFGDSRRIENLIEGRYRLTISDEDGAIIRDSINLLKANHFTYVTEVEHPSCDNTNDGSILIDSIMGGQMPVQLKWGDGELFLAERNELNVGIYDVTFTDPMGCQTSDTFELIANSIQTDLMTTDVTCLNGADGGFSMAISGGAPGVDDGYSIVYDNDTIGGFLVVDDSLLSGVYPVVIEDSIGCIKVENIEINPGISFGADELIVEHVACFGETSGSIYLEPLTLNGDEILPYRFEWMGAELVVVDSISILMDNLGPGSYSVSVHNDSFPSCVWDTVISIDEPPLLEIETATVTPASCEPGGDGSATISISGGSPVNGDDYFVFWEVGQDSTTATGLDAGTYTVIVSDVGGCQMNHMVEVPNTEPPALIGASAVGMRCDSLPAGSIITVFSSPFGIDNYLWSTGDTTSSIDSISPGVYTVMVTDNNGCSDTFEVDAPPPSGPTIDEVIIGRIRCQGDSNGYLVVQYDTSASISTILWNGIEGGDSLINLPADTYEVRIVDTLQCLSAETVVLSDPDSLIIQFEVVDDTSNMATGQVVAEVRGGWPPYDYLWSADTSVTDSVLSNLESGYYAMEVIDGEGCSIVDSAFVDMVSSIDNTSHLPDFSIFPNPAGSYLVLRGYQTRETSADRVDFYSTGGKLLRSINLTENSNETRIDIRQLQPGLYFLVLSSDDVPLNTRLIEKF